VVSTVGAAEPAATASDPPRSALSTEMASISGEAVASRDDSLETTGPEKASICRLGVPDELAMASPSATDDTLADAPGVGSPALLSAVLSSAVVTVGGSGIAKN
jgi:hypothetical protein